MTMAAETAVSGLGFYTPDSTGSLQQSNDTSQATPIITDETVLEDFYEIPLCVGWIRERQLKRVALQFPDCMLADATLVTITLRKQCADSEFYVLADTSYGSCCVDEVAAAHVSSDGLIHFGHSCLSPASRLPVLHVFGKKPLDSEDAAQQFLELVPETDTKLVVFYDVIYKHAIEDLFAKLKSCYINAVLSRIELDQSAERSDLPSANCCQCSGKGECSKRKNVVGEGGTAQLGRRIDIPDDANVEEFSAFYVGEEGPCLLNLMLTFNKCPFYSYDPETKRGRKETLSVNKHLMKRYYLIEKAKDADIVGILVGTLGVANFQSIIAQQKKMIREAGKKVYTLVVGKINVPKLASFSEIDVFVLIACPENSLLDSKDFYKPVVTPFEMEIACNAARSWTGDYITDFHQLLPGAASHLEVVPSDLVEMSLISGKMRSAQVKDSNLDDNDVSDNSWALVKRDDMAVSLLHKNAAGEFLHDRSWKGLEIQLGRHDVKKAEQGQHGTASMYQHETT